MDFDLIDAAGTAAIFSDGGKPAVITQPGGGRFNTKIFIDQEVDEFDEDESTSENRLIISIDNADRCGGLVVKNAIVDCDAGSFVLIRRIYNDRQLIQWEARARG